MPFPVLPVHQCLRGRRGLVTDSLDLFSKVVLLGIAQDSCSGWDRPTGGVPPEGAISHQWLANGPARAQGTRCGIRVRTRRPLPFWERHFNGPYRCPQSAGRYRANRKPMLVPLPTGPTLLRSETRRLAARLFQPPPREIRVLPSLLQSAVSHHGLPSLGARR